MVDQACETCYLIPETENPAPEVQQKYEKLKESHRTLRKKYEKMQQDQTQAEDELLATQQQLQKAEKRIDDMDMLLAEQNKELATLARKHNERKT